MLCPVVASSIFKWRCYNTFMRCCVTCTFTTLQAISYVIMHFKCFIVACFVLDIYGYFGVLLTWWLLFTTLVCPTHSSHYRTNVLFTMSRIIFLSLCCLLLICTWHSLASVFYLESRWSVYSPTLLRHCGMSRISFLSLRRVSVSIYNRHGLNESPPKTKEHSH